MSGPKRRELSNGAPVPVHRPKNWLRKHWLTGALLFGLVGFAARTGVHLYQTELQIEQARTGRQDLDSQVEQAREVKESLESQWNRVTSDAYREVLAKQYGYVHPGETVYQKGK
ncbi:MAG: septum formation initiator family protein [Mycobacterium leprae]